MSLKINKNIIKNNYDEITSGNVLACRRENERAMREKLTGEWKKERRESR
jgi:hypothetical protein